MKYAWIGAHIKAFALIEMCAVLDVSVSGYRAWKRGGKPDRRRLTDDQMLAVIRAIHAELKGAYGSPRMMRELRLQGFTAGKERVERLRRTKPTGVVFDRLEAKYPSLTERPKRSF